MPEISTFFDREDEHSLVQFIFAQGGHLISDLHPSPHCQTLKDFESYIAARPHKQLFFILFDSYDECPLKLRPITSGHDAGKYYVMQRVGGPTINLLTSVQYHKDGIDWISGGGLSYYPTYENTITGEMEKPPEAIVKQYKHIASHLKNEARMIKGQSGRKYLIGPHTYRLIEQGKLKLGVEGLNV